MFERPDETEYAPFYAGYVSLVPESEVLAVLAAQADEVRALAARVPPGREQFRYAPGKWSVREVMGHIADTERVFGYRATCIARGDQSPFPSFDENAYVENATFDASTLESLASEFLHLRAANLAALGRLTPEATRRRGTASGKLVTVRGLAYMMAGHVRHHVRLLGERYGVV
jgi:hypothetical protein